MNLGEIFKKHGSDKAAHGYHAVYEKLTEPETMLEVGVFKGASLRAWSEWFPGAAEIVGLDTFDRSSVAAVKSALWDTGVILVAGDSRTHLFPPGFTVSLFDLIIDDGSHRPRDQAATLRNLWPLLAPGGRYFVEDVLPVDLLGDRLPPWFNRPASRRNDFTMEAFLELTLAVQATGGELKRHDFRAQSGLPDSVLLEIRKPNGKAD